MLYCEDYTLSFALMEAEQELFSNLTDTIVTEAYNDKIVSYLNKVMQSTQKSWNKFKQVVATEKDKSFLLENEKLLNNGGPIFTVQDYIAYNLTIFNRLQVIPFNYGTMQDNFESREKFISTYYSNILDPNISTKKDIKEKIETRTFNLKCNPADVKNFYKFCREGFYTTRESIEKDLEKLNNSVNTINREVNTIVSTEESASNSMISEAPVMGINFNKNKSNNSSIENKKKRNEGNRYYRGVVLYMKLSTQIISTKMKMLSNIYYDYYEILTIAKDTYKSKIKNSSTVNQVKI